MPSLVTYFTVTADGEGTLNRTASFTARLPTFPSTTLASPTLTVGSSVPSTMVTLACAVPRVALIGPESATVKCSDGSATASASTGTATVVLVAPAAIWATPSVAT